MNPATVMTEFTREEMMRCLFEKYDEHFQDNRIDVSYRVVCRPIGHIHADTPLIITEDPEIDYISTYILDCALECELNFKGTFWLEVMRVLQFEVHTLDDEPTRPREELFDHFLHFMLSFNDVYSRTLPPIFHDMNSLRHVAAFYRRRSGVEPLLIYKMETMQMYIAVSNPEDDPIFEEDFPQEDSPEEDSPEREVPMSYEELFDRLSVTD
jgi:hypothetical protein